MGGAIGYGIVNAFIAFNHIHVYSKFDFIVSKGLNGWVGKNMMNLPLTIFSLLKYPMVAHTYLSNHVS